MDPIGIVNLKFDTNENRASRVSVIHVCNSSCWCCNLGGVERRRGSKTQWERSRTATKLTPASYYKCPWPILFDIIHPALQKKNTKCVSLLQESKTTINYVRLVPLVIHKTDDENIVLSALFRLQTSFLLLSVFPTKKLSFADIGLDGNLHPIHGLGQTNAEKHSLKIDLTKLTMTPNWRSSGKCHQLHPIATLHCYTKQWYVTMMHHHPRHILARVKPTPGDNLPTPMNCLAPFASIIKDGLL